MEGWQGREGNVERTKRKRTFEPFSFYVLLSIFGFRESSILIIHLKVTNVELFFLCYHNTIYVGQL